jgi:hypothetical protein
VKTVMGLIPNDERVAAVSGALLAAEYSANQIDIFAEPSEVWQQLESHVKWRKVSKSVLAGMLFGAAIGALYGVLTAILNCRLLNCPVERSLVMLALISLFWIVGGGFIGAIVGFDRLECDFCSYVEGVRRGAALFVIESPKKRSPVAAGILAQEQGELIHAF